MRSNDDYDYEYSTLISDECLNYNEIQSETIDDTNDGNISIESEPKDRYGFVSITFAVLGLSQLLPWNFLITANDYWMYKFRDINNTVNTMTVKTELQTYFDSYLSMASNVPFLVILLLNAFFGHKVREDIRNMFSFGFIIFLFILTTVFVNMNTDNYQQIFLGLTISSVLLLSVSAAFLQASVAGIASVFPSECMHSMVSGQAVSGLFASVAQLLFLSGEWNVIKSAFYYFTFADITLVSALIMYLIMRNTDYYKFHKQKLTQSRRQLDSFPGDSERKNYVSTILLSVWPHGLSVMFAFWVSLALFPAITVLVSPENGNTSVWTGKYFLPLTCFLLFNLGDFVGRITGKFCPIPLQKPYLLLVLSLSRIIFIPLIMLCNATPRSHLPVVFKSEVYYILFMTLLGLTNGYIIVNGMISGPMFVTHEYRENTGFFLVAFLGLGLTLGSFTSNILLRIL